MSIRLYYFIVVASKCNVEDSIRQDNKKWNHLEDPSVQEIVQLISPLLKGNVGNLKNYGEEEQDLDYSVVPESTGGCLVFEGEVKYGPSSYVHGNRNPLGRIHQVTCDDILFQ